MATVYEKYIPYTDKEIQNILKEEMHLMMSEKASL